MALASLPCNADFESKWILSTRVRFFELSKVALKTLPVSQTYCFAGIDPGHFCNVTYGDSVKLQSTLVCHICSHYSHYHVRSKLIVCLCSTKSMFNTALLICYCAAAMMMVNGILNARRYVPTDGME